MDLYVSLLNMNDDKIRTQCEAVLSMIFYDIKTVEMIPKLLHLYIYILYIRIELNRWIQKQGYEMLVKLVYCLNSLMAIILKINDVLLFILF